MVGVLVLGAIGLGVLIAISPFLLIAALAILLIAWRWPAPVHRVSSHPRLSRVPIGLRSTPMRFASLLVAVALALTGIDVAIVGAGNRDDEIGAGQTSAPSRAVETETLAETPAERATSTIQPTPEATVAPTPAPTPVFGQEPTGPSEIGQVVNVVDGDTIDVVINGVEVRVRYIGMDTPETRSGVEWMGPEASAANASLVADKEVVLEKDVSETDRYGRALRYVWIRDGAGWLLINRELVRLGFAQVATYPPDVKYADTVLLSAQEQARAEGIGLWSAKPTPVPRPRATPVTPPPATPAPPSGNCEPSYPRVCIPIGSADLDCGEIQYRRFTVIWNVANPDPHGFDGDGDGIGCES